MSAAVSILFPRAVDQLIDRQDLSPDQQIIRDCFDLIVKLSSVIDDQTSRLSVLEELAGRRNVRQMTAHLKGQVQ